MSEKGKEPAKITLEEKFENLRDFFEDEKNAITFNIKTAKYKFGSPTLFDYKNEDGNKRTVLEVQNKNDTIIKERILDNLITAFSNNINLKNLMGDSFFAYVNLEGSENNKTIFIEDINEYIAKGKKEKDKGRVIYNYDAYKEQINPPKKPEEIEATPPSSSISPELVTEVAKFVGSLEERINQLGLDIKKINADVKKRQLLTPKELQERIDTFDDETLAKLERELNDLRLYNFKNPETGELEAGISEDTYKLYMDIIGRKRYSRKRDKTVYPPLVQRPIKPNVPMNYNR